MDYKILQSYYQSQYGKDGQSNSNINILGDYVDKQTPTKKTPPKIRMTKAQSSQSNRVFSNSLIKKTLKQYKSKLPTSYTCRDLLLEKSPLLEDQSPGIQKQSYSPLLPQQVKRPYTQAPQLSRNLSQGKQRKCGVLQYENTQDSIYRTQRPLQVLKSMHVNNNFSNINEIIMRKKNQILESQMENLNLARYAQKCICGESPCILEQKEDQENFRHLKTTPSPRNQQQFDTLETENSFMTKDYNSVQYKTGNLQNCLTSFNLFNEKQSNQKAQYTNKRSQSSQQIQIILKNSRQDVKKEEQFGRKSDYISQKMRERSRTDYQKSQQKQNFMMNQANKFKYLSLFRTLNK